MATKKSETSSVEEIIASSLQDLKILDKKVPTMVGNTIDVLAVNKKNRVILVDHSTAKLANEQTAFRYFVDLHSKWSFFCDFKDDFFTALNEKEIEPMALPPRIYVLADYVSPYMLSYVKYFKQEFIDIDVLQRKPVENGETAVYEPVGREIIKKAKDLRRPTIHRFNLEHGKRWGISLDIYAELNASMEFKGAYPMEKEAVAEAKRLAREFLV